jgi:hypothetical protein
MSVARQLLCCTGSDCRATPSHTDIYDIYSRTGIPSCVPKTESPQACLHKHITSPVRRRGNGQSTYFQNDVKLPSIRLDLPALLPSRVSDRDPRAYVCFPRQLPIPISKARVHVSIAQQIDKSIAFLHLREVRTPQCVGLNGKNLESALSASPILYGFC